MDNYYIFDGVSNIFQRFSAKRCHKLLIKLAFLENILIFYDSFILHL